MPLRALIALLACVALATHGGAQSPRAPVIALRNGHWWSGSTFEDRVMYVVGGVFSAAPPPHVDSTIDLHSGWVVPPFADAHNHNVEYTNPARTDALLAMYVREGVFYDQNPDNLARSRPGLAGRVNVPAGVDVAFANGGLTATGGHPTGLFLRNLGLGIFTRADGDGGMLWYIDSLPDLDRKWPAILEQRPDFIKTFLLHSEEYRRRRNDSTYFNWRGLDPALLPEIVRRAHLAGLRVMSHIETAADFHNALAAGVDEIGHIPGFRGDEDGRLKNAAPYIIADSDAALAARRRVAVITTLGVATRYASDGPDSLLRRQFDSLNAANLRTLKRRKVWLAVGSDAYRTTAVPEAMYLQSLGVLSNAELLDVWTRATPQAIFPARKIGELREGFEATFLVLAGNPLLDFTNTTRIVLRMKQGYLLAPPVS
jgi:imidazolonepropionase-like amidohydrolase